MSKIANRPSDAMRTLQDDVVAVVRPDARMLNNKELDAVTGGIFITYRGPVGIQDSED